MRNAPVPEGLLPPNSVLRRIFATRRVVLSDGTTHALDSETSEEECVAMYEFLVRNPPDVAIEIGMSWGVSSLAILTALEQNGRGTLISIDPYSGEYDHARQSALLAIDEAGLSHRHRHLHVASELALPRLVEDTVSADFIYIDGHHGFDHVFIDLFFADCLCRIGGTIAFDDTMWRSVHRVIRYLQRHRQYEELDVGLRKSFQSRNVLYHLYKRLQNRFGPSRYFRKKGDWTPPSNFYRPF